MVAQIHYWLDNAIDQMNALDAFLTGTEAMATNDAAKLWDSYYKGLKFYEQSQTHTFHYVDHMEKAELGVQHIRPFILSLKEVLASEVQKSLASRPNHQYLYHQSNRCRRWFSRSSGWRFGNSMRLLNHQIASRQVIILV